jgi:hypothetical protein
MFRGWKLSQNTVAQRLGALRFFYTQVLKQTWSTAETALSEDGSTPAAGAQPGKKSLI